MCSDRCKNGSCGQKKTEGTTSARFCLRDAAKCDELKRCADRVGSRTDNKDEVVEGKFINLNFLTTTVYSFELLLSIYGYLLFFSQVLNFTSVELNRFAKQAELLKNLFFKSDSGHAISRQEKHRLPKSTLRFPAKKRWYSPPPPRRVVLELPSPSPRVCMDGRAGWRALTSQPKCLGSIGYQICLGMVLRLRASARAPLICYTCDIIYPNLVKQFSHGIL